MPIASRVAVLVTAAGRSERFGGVKKELLRLGQRSILDAAIEPFISLDSLCALVITAPPGREQELEAGLEPDTRAALRARLADRFLVVAGGEERRDSVRLGLGALARILGQDLAAGCLVLIHDAARPFASPELVHRVGEIAAREGACVPVVPLVDTPKELGPDGRITAHPPRSSLGAAQTPQGFTLLPLIAAHERAVRESVECTDDAELWARYIGPVAWTAGEATNRKITFPGDLDRHRDLPAKEPEPLRGTPPPFRVGQGWDIHRLVPGRELRIGGVVVPFELGEEAHSDGDVLLHAVTDALLGAAALGDIGSLFPPSDPQWRDADSRGLLRSVLALLREHGYRPGTLDSTVTIERPRLGPHRGAICESLAACMGLDVSAVSLKAKTREGLDSVGSGQAVEASAIVTLFPV